MPLRQLFPAVNSHGGDTDVSVDIIAVHGLNPRSKNDADHAWDTWRTPSGPHGRLWLRDDLPRHITESRIFLYQYNSTAVYGKDRDTSVGKASELLEAIRIERDGVESRPIIFLCHSLGGLLVKQALINAQNNPKYAQVKAATYGLAFFATPHNGGNGKLVGLGAIASKIATVSGFQKGDDILEMLKSGNTFSDILQEHWRHQQLQYTVISFWGALDNIVPVESACLGMPGDREHVVKLNADHRGVCKFGPSETEQDNLRLVCANIRDLFCRATGYGHPSQRGRQCEGRPRAHFIVPSLRNKNFTGRNAILDTLQKKLFIQRECQKLAVVGLGGVGKTQVALQFAHWVREHQPECSVFWVPALSAASFTQAYMEIGKKMGVNGDSKEDQKKSVQQHLNQEDAGRWLLIVDNADSMDVLFGSPDGAAGIYEWLPDNESGLILFTTRFREVGIAVATSDVIELHEMDEEKAEGFLKKSLIRKELLRDEAVTAMLLRELTYLPLAITQAAAYLNRNNISIRRYLELLSGTGQDLVNLMSREFHDNTRYLGSQNAVATTWLVSFEQIQKSDAVVADLLAFMSCIEPKRISRSLLSLIGTYSEEALEFAIGTLSSYAFLARQGDDEMYDMHSLVHLAAGIWLQKTGRKEEVIANAIGRVDALILTPVVAHINPRWWLTFVPHFIRLLHQATQLAVARK